MKATKLFLMAALVGSCLFAKAQDNFDLVRNTDVEKYKSYNQVTLFDSTDVFMEESGLSYVNSHRLVKIINYAGAKANSVVKIDYDPQSAYVEIKKVVVYRANGETTEFTGPVMDYVAPARMIYWGASQKMLEVGHLDPGDAVEVWTFRKGLTYALLQADVIEAEGVQRVQSREMVQRLRRADHDERDDAVDHEGLAELITGLEIPADKDRVEQSEDEKRAPEIERIGVHERVRPVRDRVRENRHAHEGEDRHEREAAELDQRRELDHGRPSEGKDGFNGRAGRPAGINHVVNKDNGFAGNITGNFTFSFGWRV